MYVDVVREAWDEVDALGVETAGVVVGYSGWFVEAVLDSYEGIETVDDLEDEQGVEELLTLVLELLGDSYP